MILIVALLVGIQVLVGAGNAEPGDADGKDVEDAVLSA